MRILLDTHVFLWATSGSRRLGRQARALLARAEAVHVSSASIWEVAIKAGLGRLRADPSELAKAIAPSGFLELPVTARHAARVAALPAHHRDPFDRILLAQALSEPLVLVTADEMLARYGPFVEVVGR